MSSAATGVGQRRIASVRVVPVCAVSALSAVRPAVALQELFPSLAVAVGQQEEPLPPLRGRNFRRLKSEPFDRIPPVFGQVLDNPSGRSSLPGESPGNKEACDVLKEEVFRSYLPKNAACFRPEVARVRFELPLACDTGGLTRHARNDAIHDPTPRPAVEGSQVGPNRAVVQGAFAHARRQDRHGKRLPLDHAHDARARCRDSQSEVQPADSGTEGQHIEGR